MSGISFARDYPCTAAVVQDQLVYSDDGVATPTTGPTQVPIGISRCGAVQKQDETYQCSVATFGVVEYAIASAAIALGADVMPASGGRVVTAGAGAGNVTLGQAMDAAAAAGDKIRIKMYGPFSVAST